MLATGKDSHKHPMMSCMRMAHEDLHVLPKSCYPTSGDLVGRTALKLTLEKVVTLT